MNKKQSLFHIAKRDSLPWYKAALIRGGAIVLALIVCAIVTTLLTGENPALLFRKGIPPVFSAEFSLLYRCSRQKTRPENCLCPSLTPPYCRTHRNVVRCL